MLAFIGLDANAIGLVYMKELKPGDSFLVPQLR